MGRARRALALAGAVALALLFPAIAHAQGRVHPVGVVLLGGPYMQAIDRLRERLRELGFGEGKQYALLVRDAKGDLKAAAAAAKSLEAEKVDLIFALGSSVAFTTMTATQSVPVVFHSGADPVAVELVGVVAFYNPSNPTRYDVAAMHDAARGLKMQFVERWVGTVEERAALRGLRPGDADAILYVGDAMVSSQAQLMIETRLTKRLPTMLQEEGSVAMGALASYGVSFRAIGRLAAKHVHRILLGARPGDLPVERFDRLHLAINLMTAKAIGVTVPPSVLTRADEIIQ